jgi:hypothetical protein
LDTKSDLTLYVVLGRDPLNMLDGADQERFDRLRYVEIKHGRKYSAIARDSLSLGLFS